MVSRESSQYSFHDFFDLRRSRIIKGIGFVFFKKPDKFDPTIPDCLLKFKDRSLATVRYSGVLFSRFSIDRDCFRWKSGRVEVMSVTYFWMDTNKREIEFAARGENLFRCSSCKSRRYVFVVCSSNRSLWIHPGDSKYYFTIESLSFQLTAFSFSLVATK